MNGLLIALACIFVVLLIAINIYLLALYVHTDDKDLGTALYCKVLVVLGLTLCQAQGLMVPLDVANNSGALQNLGGIDMKSFWYLVFLTVLIFICLLLPFALFFYETDEDENIFKRVGKAMLYTIAANIISTMMLFISWNFFKYVELPVHTVAAYEINGIDNISFSTLQQQTQGDITLEIEASFAVYVIAIMSFFGWIFLVIFGGVGLFALPIDMINEFRRRPKARRSDDMMKTKRNLVNAISALIKNGEDLKQADHANYKNQQSGLMDRWRGKRQVSNKLTQFKAKYFSLEEEFDVFNLELKFADTNPIVPFLKLVLGIIFLLTSLMWVLQIILGNIAQGFFDKPLNPLMNQLLIQLNDSSAGFLATGIYAYLCLYMLWCVQKGTVKFGMRIPWCCRFHPMKQGQTWMNSFLFNVILMLIASVGVIQLCISSFPYYTRNTEIYMMVGLQLQYMKFYSTFYQKDVFAIALIAWTALTLIYMLITCNKKPPYMQQIDRIRNHDID